MHADGNLRLHPHNIIQEIAVDAGWLAAAAFVILIGAIGVLTIRASFRALADPTDPCPIRTLVVFAALSYWFWCAAFSGDVNDHRALCAMIGMALAAQAGWRNVGPAVTATMAKLPAAAQSLREQNTVLTVSSAPRVSDARIASRE